MSRAILNKLDDANARIERSIFLAGALAAMGAFPEDLDDYFDDLEVEDINACFGEIPEYVDVETRGYARSDGILEWLLNSQKLGFLVQFATPVMTPTGKNSYSFSWGNYYTKWIYADTIEEAVDKGLAWVKKQRKSDDARAKRAKTEGGA